MVLHGLTKFGDLFARFSEFGGGGGGGGGK
jgi:hypothetical protein